MKVLAVVQARMGSTRTPGKVMRDLAGSPVLRWTINALDRATGIDAIVLATSQLPADDVIAQYCHDYMIECFRGSEADVLDRFYQCAKKYRADIILRLTADCPFLDPAVISEVIKLREITNASYASNIDPPTYPDGLDVECFTFAALEAAWCEATRPTDRDCVPQYIYRNRHRFPAVNLTCPLPGLGGERWVLDTEADYEFCKEVAERWKGKHVLYHDYPSPSYLDILTILDKEPKLRALNPGKRNERFYEGLANDVLPIRTFKNSQLVLDRAIKTIPFGAQTFSKSHLQYPVGRSPLYCTHADGSRIFDVDGNDYVDLVNAILPVVLGYRDPDVDQAIRRQLDSGISFSLSTEIEAELSELIRRLVPCAEMVKFGKSGTDVTSAAIRLARAHTGRKHVLMSSYHGWADWSMATTDRCLGIPDPVKVLSHKFQYGKENDPTLNTWKRDAAAVIVEATHGPAYLYWLRKFCDENGIVLIFDEVITGFRWSLGGAQKHFGVKPDLATFGKAMANGMPISAIAGKRDIMMRMSPPDNIFYSGTMFGETLSIAAAIACIKKLEREGVPDYLWQTGAIMRERVANEISDLDLTHTVILGGQAPRVTIEFSEDQPNATGNQLKSLFMQEMTQAGVLILGSNNISFSIRGPEMQRIGFAYRKAFRAIRSALDKGDIGSRISKLENVSPFR